MSEKQETHTEQLIITYEDFSKYMDEAVKHFKEKPFANYHPITHIYGPPRGAWPIVAHLANHLNLKVITDLHAFIRQVDHDCENYQHGILIVDDVADSGRTLADITRFMIDYEFYNYTIYTICKKPQTVVWPSYYNKEVSNYTWIYFPWEELPNDS
jgi:hypoxanthine phosphoribosyltransferase